MKRISYLLSFLVLSLSSMAGPLTHEEAKAVALQFVNQQVGKLHSQRHQAPRTVAQLLTAVDAPSYHVFNIGTDDGFVIVSADEGEIMGYANSGSFSAADMPQSLRAWLDEYARQATLLSPGQKALRRAARRASSSVKTAISPMVTARWNQSSPFNDQCPRPSAYGSTRCPAGCAAIAMGQVMFFHQYPQQTTQSIPNYTPDSGVSYGKSLGVTTFSWSNIKADYTSGGGTAAKEAVAEFIKYVGASIKMGYTAEGSGTDVAEIPGALIQYFGYDPSARYVSRNQYSYEGWRNLIYDELAARRPVVLGGSAVVSGALYGHAFVCDGYDGDGLYHINWGWAGRGDGYYNLDLLFPTANNEAVGPDGYSLFEVAVVGIQHTGAEAVDVPDAPTTTNQYLTVNSASQIGSATINTVQTLRLNITNTSTTQPYYGNLILYFGTAEGEHKANSGISINLEPGETRSIDMHYKTAQTSQPIVITATPSASTSAPEDIVYQTTLTLKDPSELPAPTLTFTSSVDNTSGSNLYGSSFVYRLTVTNTSDGDFEGEIAATLLDGKSWDEITTQRQNAAVAAGTSQELVFVFPDLTYKNKYFVRAYNGSQLVNTSSYYTLAPGLTVYKADGTSSVIGGTSFKIPADAVAADFRGLSIYSSTSVTASQNPNCLYYLDSTVPAALKDKNIIVDGTAQRILLTDQKEFYVPSPFTAATIQFTRTFTLGYDGMGGGWSTLVLPFVPTLITADDQPIDWFHYSGQEGKQFWIYDFYAEDGDAVLFRHAAELQAYHPYIISVPTDIYGPEWQLTGKPILFTATDVTVEANRSAKLTGNQFQMIGTFAQLDSSEEAFVLNSTGSIFERGPLSVSPFHAYFVGPDRDASANAMRIAFHDPAPTGIALQQSADRQPANAPVYHINGQRIATSDQWHQLPKGIYIVNGKKAVKTK